MMVLQVVPELGKEFWLQQSVVTLFALAIIYFMYKHFVREVARLTKGLKESTDGRIKELKETSIVLGKANDVMNNVLDLSRNLPENVRREINVLHKAIEDKALITHEMLNRIIDKSS